MKVEISKLRPTVASLAYEKVDKYRELYEKNETCGIRPVTVIPEEGRFIILDGHHKSCGAYKAGKKEIECEVHDGSEPRSLRDLLLHAEQKGIFSIMDLEDHLIPYFQRKDGR